MTGFEWLGVVFVAFLSIFFPRTILAILAWSMLEYGWGGAVILFILTVLLVMSDLR